MVGKKDFQGCADISKAGYRRLRDAEALLALKEPLEHAQCAKYVAGYAVECKLKAMAMEMHSCYTLKDLSEKLEVSEKDIFTHSLEKLVKQMPSLYNRLQSNESVRRVFVRLNNWCPAWRYKPGEVTKAARKSASDFLADVKVVYNWLEQNRG